MRRRCPCLCEEQDRGSPAPDGKVKLPGGQTWAVSRCAQGPWWLRVTVRGPVGNPEPLRPSRGHSGCGGGGPASLPVCKAPAGTAAPPPPATPSHSPCCSRDSRRVCWDPGVVVPPETEPNKNLLLPLRMGWPAAHFEPPWQRWRGPPDSLSAPSATITGRHLKDPV